MTEGLTKKELEDKEKAISAELVNLKKIEKEFSQAAHVALARKLQSKLDIIRVRNDQAQVKALIDECHEIKLTAAPIG